MLKLSHPSFIMDTLYDVTQLSHYLRQERFDIVNVHHCHDHVLGRIAARRADRVPLVLRTDHKRNSMPPTWGNRLLISRLTDGIITFSKKARKACIERFHLPAERVGKIPPALDLERYARGRSFKDMRALFRIDPGDVVIGMTARFQQYRRTDVFLEAMQIIVREVPKVKLLLVGRSSQMERALSGPEKTGDRSWVILAGYRTEDYVDTLACMDIFVFLMPGSDGTARALREVMALGKPVVVSDQGMLPELIEHGVSGWVVKITPEELAAAVLTLLRSPELREAMGKAAYERAHQGFQLGQQVEAVEAFYQRLMDLGKWRKG